MLAKEFFFSFSLLAFAGILMIIGVLLLLDATRRFAMDAYRTIRPKVRAEPAAISTPTAPKTPQEKLPSLEEAA